MNLEQAMSALEGMHADPMPAIEFLIASEPGSAGALLARLATLQTGNRPPFEIAITLSHPLLHNVHFRLPRRLSSSTAKLATRRIIIALGAMRSTQAIPALLDVLTRTSDDTKLGEALGWALATIGEAALLPLFSFARCRAKPPPARALAITTIGYIPDLRVLTILNHLWREYRLQEPCLAIATLMGLAASGQADEAKGRAREIQRVWYTQPNRRGRLQEMEFEAAVTALHHTLENTSRADSLPAWSSVVQILGH